MSESDAEADEWYEDLLHSFNIANGIDGGTAAAVAPIKSRVVDEFDSLGEARAWAAALLVGRRVLPVFSELGKPAQLAC